MTSQRIAGLPKRLPWSQFEELTDSLRNLTARLDNLIALWSTITPQITIDGRIGEFTTAVNKIYTALQNFAPGGAPLTYSHYPLEWGQATGGSATKLLCTGKRWATNIWQGCELTIVEGSGSGQSRWVESNDRTSITVRTNLDVVPDSSSVFVIRTRAILENKPAWKHGQKNVAAAGTAEQLPDITVPTGCQLIILAKPTNTGYIYLGKTEADAESTTGRFESLEAGVGIPLAFTNANLVWIDASVNGEGVSYLVPQAV